MTVIGQQWYFGFTGAVQTFVVPQDVKKIMIECWGGIGGGNWGYGGYSYGELSPTPGETLYIYAGGNGDTYGNPGWNGGGAGGNLGAAGARGGGGGASDIRRGGTSLNNRIIVAGGGGGGGGVGEEYEGGYGGGLSGTNGKGYNIKDRYGGGAGTQNSGGNRGSTVDDSTAGTFGQGGKGGRGTYHSGGGGGGGWYGGGGGARSNFSSYTSTAGGGGSGYISGVVNGSTMVSTSNGGNVGSVRITVLELNPTPVTGVTLNKSATTINKGNTEQLAATIAPSNATNKNVTWLSNNNLVATIDSTGKVTAVGKGTCTITVITQDGGKTTTCQVTVNVPATGISLNKSSITLAVGGNDQLVATVSPADASNANVSWSSNDISAAIVDSTGKVTANSTKSGSCTITATTVDGGFVATCIVTVYIPVTSISLNKSSTTINKGGYETLVATIQPSNATNKNISWSSSNPNVATVDPNGKVSALMTGTARITVTTQDGNKTANCDVTVYVDVTGITLDATEVTIEKGTSRTLVATISPSDAFEKRVTWSSSDNSIVAVDASGKVTGIAGGTATITATTVDGNKTAACIVHVHIAVNSITLAPATTDLHLIGKLQLTVTVFPEDATVKDVIWTVNSQDLASINTQGLLTAIAAGMVTVTVATVEGNFTATSRVNIYQPVNDKLTSFGVNSVYSRNKDVTYNSLLTIFNVAIYNDLLAYFGVIQPYTQDGDKYGRNILTQFVVSKFSRLVGRFKVDKRLETVVRLEPIKDSSINDILDTVTFGDGLEMLVGYHATTDEIYRSFIQFDMSSIPLKSNNIEILSAKLSLYVVGTHPAMTVEVMNVTEDWFEYWIVWFNRPDTEDTYVKTFNIPEEEGWIELDFQEILCSWCGESKEIYGFVIQSTDEARDAYIRLYTRESDFSPYLVVTYRDLEIVNTYWSDVWTDFTVRQESSKSLYTHFKMRQTGQSSLVIRYSVVRSSELATQFNVRQKSVAHLPTTFDVWYAENIPTTFTVRQEPVKSLVTSFEVRVPATYDKKTEFTVWYAHNIPTRFKATYRSEFDTYTEFDIYYGKDVITTFKATYRSEFDTYTEFDVYYGKDVITTFNAKGPEKSSITTRFIVREAAAVSDTFTLFDVVYAKPLKTLFKARQRSIHNKLTRFVVRKITEYDKVTRLKIRVDRNNGLVTIFTVVRRMKAYAFIM